MTNEIFISLKPKFAELIKRRQKNHEFRRYKPKYSIQKFWIYVNKPISQLKYVAEIADPIEYPNQIPENGVGNVEFNQGLKKSKFAYYIIHFYEITNPMGCEELRKRFKFLPPQRFVYADKHPKLIKFMHNLKWQMIF